MKAIQIQSDQSLSWDTVTDLPAPTGNHLSIQVKTTAVNRADLMQRKGLYPPPPGASDILGLECAGEVIAVGPDVTGWKAGDRVCALLSGGGYAETVVCPASHVLPIPEGFTFAEAAALPEVFATAWLNLFMLGNLQPDQKVLLHAGASGVGTAAIQLCKQFGNPVFVTVGDPTKLDRCVELGADAGHLRTQGPFEEAVKSWAGKAGVSVILDPVGGNYLEQNIKCLNTDGSLVIIGLMGGRTGELDLGRLLMKRIQVTGSTLRSRSDNSKAHIISQLNNKVWPFFTQGKLKPIIDRQYSIEQANEAFDLVGQNRTTGKVILNMPG